MNAADMASAADVRGHLRHEPAVEGAGFVHEVLAGGQHRYRWTGGEVVLASARVQAWAEGTRLCLSVGAPRFDRRSAGERTPGADARTWLDLFEAFGEDAPNRVRGRFGAILIDAARAEIVLVTDRFGTHPWCFAASGEVLSFSDRADEVGTGGREIDLQGLFNYFYFHTIPAPFTVFRGVGRLPQASTLRWNGQGPRIASWWTVRFEEPRTAPLAELKQEFLEIVREAVGREAAAGEIGSFLSGGTDSSTVSGMLCRLSGKAARSYSIGFDAEGYDEMAYARIAARHFGTDHHEYYVTPEDLLEAIPAVAAHYDQPFGNSSAVPAWLCARRAQADGITKMLAGDGGDELFGGNARYAKQRVFGWYSTVPQSLRTVLVEPLLALPGVRAAPLLRKGASYVEQARVPLPDRMQMYNLLHRLGPGEVFPPAFLAGVDQAVPLRMQRETWQAATAREGINRMLAFDWKYTLADNDLPKVIGTTRLAGLDVGFPLLADELLAFSLRLPAEWKLKGLTLRWFFKEALRGFLPEAILKKKKHGFGLPFGVWAASHQGLSRLARDSVESFAARGLLRTEFADRLMNRLLREHPGYYGEMVWIVMVAEQWMQAREAQSGFRLHA